MKAMKYYFDTTGRQVTFEYTLIRGDNDSIDDATGLSALARPLGALVNLIPVNPVKERGFVQTDAPAVASFKNKLENSGINVTIRREMGRDIDGACGQLRRRHLVKS
ncbi:MAG: 23S rRNA (adenine(2503)-C(2))-methyltransferase RlmN, partial [Lachnospiraceae bacterium]|nr:23S rRNA (adenine(2503)-C(2))-methyltransferase RlmN [Lachnospiraceae bacterium]